MRTSKYFFYCLLGACVMLGCSDDSMLEITPNHHKTDDNNGDISDENAGDDDENAGDDKDKTGEDDNKTGDDNGEGNDDDTTGNDDDPNDGDEEDDTGTTPCTNQCDDGANKCDNNSIWHCEMQDTGCTDWNEISACETGTKCDDKTFTCVAGCYETCDETHNTRCNESNLETCQNDENGCAVWSTLDSCEAGCNTAELQCNVEEQECTDECSEGAQMCNGNGIQHCITGDNGCTYWGNETSCQSGEECDSNTAQCVKTCTSECTKGEVRATATSIQLCEDSNGNGCMKWGSTTTCKAGEKMNAATKQCESVCGSNCEKFSIVFIPDSQEYTRNTTGQYLKDELNWIKTNFASKNIKAVMHLGDMTDTNTEAAWKVNNTAYKTYMDVKVKDKSGKETYIPYLTAAGNHDFLQCDSNSSAVDSCTYSRGGSNMSKFGKFNADRFSGKSWFGGYKYTTNSYLTFEASGIKFLLISLEFAPRKDTICWAEKLISDHSDHKVIIATHGYLSTAALKGDRDTKNRYTSGYTAGSKAGGLPTGAGGYELYKELAARHNNIILVASGHVSASTFRINKGNAGNWFNEMVVDYQEEDPVNKRCGHSHSNGGSGGGWLRLLEFDPAKMTITASTVSANKYTTMYCTKQKSTDANGKEITIAKYPANPTTKPSNHLSVNDIANARTTNHAFVVDYDFVTPVDYKVTDGNVGFTHRSVNTVGDGNQDYPAVAISRTTRNFVSVWSDDSFDSDGKDTDGEKNQDIKARIFCETGCNKVSQFTVNTTTAGNQKTPDVAMNKDGDFVVVWRNDADSSIYMRKFNIKGKQTVAETKVNTSGKASNPQVAMADDGSFVVTWQNGDVYMRGFDSKGQETISQKLVTTTALKENGQRLKPAIGMAIDGTYVITWQDDVDGNGYYEILARGFNKDGSERIKPFKVNTNSENQQKAPAIGMNSNGDFAIAWEDDTDGNEVYRIRMRTFNKDGSQKAADTFVSASGETASDPTVCMAKDGTAYFGWHAKTAKFTVKDENDKDEIITRALNYIASFSSAGKLSSESKLNPVYPVKTSGLQNQPDVACADNGRRVYVWHDDYDSNGYFEIMGKGF